MLYVLYFTSFLSQYSIVIEFYGFLNFAWTTHNTWNLCKRNYCYRSVNANQKMKLTWTSKNSFTKQAHTC